VPISQVEADEWIDGRNVGVRIECPKWDQIEEAIRRLDGWRKTLVVLSGDGVCHMAIGGGEGGKYVAYITFDNEAFFSLVDPSKPDGVDMQVVGAQQGDYPARMCVNLDTALKAARTYADTGQLDGSVHW
jgi:hypothetical protein